MKPLLVAVFVLVSSTTVAADDSVLSDVVYARVGERSLALDLYRSDRAGSSPVVVWVHGGAWRAGSKNDVPVKHWLSHGFAIASVDYRLSPEARFPAQIHDIKGAIRFLRANAGKWNLDADRFVVAGSSAGGHLAALVGVSDGVRELEGTVGEHVSQSSRVQAIVSFFGASNLESILGQSTAHGLSVRVPALKLLLGGLPDERPELARLASPIAHVGADDPPLWLIHGDADPQMPPEQSSELAARYREVQLPVDLETIPGGKHGGAEFFERQRLDRIARQLKASLERRSEAKGAVEGSSSNSRS
jgi:acetyl esterase/lipase